MIESVWIDQEGSLEDLSIPSTHTSIDSRDLRQALSNGLTCFTSLFTGGGPQIELRYSFRLSGLASNWVIESRIFLGDREYFENLDSGFRIGEGFENCFVRAVLGITFDSLLPR